MEVHLGVSVSSDATTGAVSAMNVSQRETADHRLLMHRARHCHNSAAKDLLDQVAPKELFKANLTPSVEILAVERIKLSNRRVRA